MTAPPTSGPTIGIGESPSSAPIYPVGGEARFTAPCLFLCREPLTGCTCIQIGFAIPPSTLDGIMWDAFLPTVLNECLLTLARAWVVHSRHARKVAGHTTSREWWMRGVTSWLVGGCGVDIQSQREVWDYTGCGVGVFKNMVMWRPPRARNN
jgi:hypothetical protein